MCIDWLFDWFNNWSLIDICIDWVNSWLLIDMCIDWFNNWSLIDMCIELLIDLIMDRWFICVWIDWCIAEVRVTLVLLLMVRALYLFPHIIIILLLDLNPLLPRLIPLFSSLSLISLNPIYSSLLPPLPTPALNPSTYNMSPSSSCRYWRINSDGGRHSRISTERLFEKSLSE